MSALYDPEEILFLASRGMSASFIQEELSLNISVRQIQRIVSSRLGRRPTRASIQKPNILRERVVAYMVSRGLNPKLCSKCGRASVRPGFIRAVNADPSLDALVFVGAECTVPGDV